MTPIEQVRDEGNCGEVTNRGEEACECVRKCRPVCRRRSHSRQSCEVTNRNRIQGRCGQVSEPIITKPSPFLRIGKSGACAAKTTRLIQGDPSHESARRACPKAEPVSVNDSGVRRKSAEVVVLSRHIPLTTGRTEPARTGWSYRCTHAEELLRPELTGVACIDQPTLGGSL